MGVAAETQLCTHQSWLVPLWLGLLGMLRLLSPIAVGAGVGLGSRPGGATWLGLPPPGPAALAIGAIGQLQLWPGQLGQQLQHLLLLFLLPQLFAGRFSCLLA